MLKDIHRYLLSQEDVDAYCRELDSEQECVSRIPSPLCTTTTASVTNTLHILQGLDGLTGAETRQELPAAKETEKEKPAAEEPQPRSAKTTWVSVPKANAAPSKVVQTSSAVVPAKETVDKAPPVEDANDNGDADGDEEGDEDGGEDADEDADEEADEDADEDADEVEVSNVKTNATIAAKPKVGKGKKGGKPAAVVGSVSTKQNQNKNKQKQTKGKKGKKPEPVEKAPSSTNKKTTASAKAKAKKGGKAAKVHSPSTRAHLKRQAHKKTDVNVPANDKSEMEPQDAQASEDDNEENDNEDENDDDTRSDTSSQVQN
jgi:hypothetical protein